MPSVTVIAVARLKRTTWPRTRGSGVRSQRPGTTITVTIVIAIETTEVIVSRHQLSAVERRQMSEVTTPYAPTASAAISAA